MNQNNVMNVDFGLNEYGRLKYMLEMAEMLHQKKLFENKIKEDPSKRDQFQGKIDELNKKAIDKLKEMEEYAKTHKQRGVVAFA